MGDDELLRIVESDLPPINVTEADMRATDRLKNQITNHGVDFFSELMKRFLRTTGLVSNDDFDIIVHDVSEAKSLDVGDINFFEEEVEIKISSIEDKNHDETRIINLTDEQRLNFGVWTAEQNVESAQLFFVNLRRNIPRMIKESQGIDASLEYDSEYYLSGQYASVLDFQRSISKWGVPLAIHSPGRHAALVLKTPEYDTESGRWRVLVYDPMTGGEDYRLLEKIADVESIYPLQQGALEEVDILSVDSDVDQDDPVANPTRYGLFVNLDNNNLMRLWSSRTYDLSVSTDQVVANNPNVEEKQKKVQFDVNNCVLASGFMGVVRAFLKYPELFSIGSRADIYKDTGVIFHLRDEFLRKVEPPSIEDLVAAGGVGE
jgi:hypothetical protein